MVLPNIHTHTHTGDLNVDISSSLESVSGSSPNLSREPSNVLLCWPESTSSISSPLCAASRFRSSNICCSYDCDNSSSGAWYFVKTYGFSPYSPPKLLIINSIFHHFLISFNYYLRQGGYVTVVVVCLSVSKFAQKLGMDLHEIF